MLSGRHQGLRLASDSGDGADADYHQWDGNNARRMNLHAKA